ncbi:Uncharacterised protein [Vibrio cholerae]|nr:Uncharacterised protein [Vibrio cholerae]
MSWRPFDALVLLLHPRDPPRLSHHRLNALLRWH